MLDWLFSLIRQLFFMIDGIIYSFIGIVYNLLEDIAETSIFTEEVIDLFASKVYALLGIFMLFKVSFSILSYIVNPDDFLDKNKGFSKIISNIIITLVLLVMTPWIFTQAMDIQRLILRDNVIGKIFSTAEVNTSVVVDPGATMAYETFKAFYFLDTDLYPECEGLETDELEDVAECKAKAFDNDSNFDLMKQSLIYAYNTNNISIYMDNTLFNSKASDGEYTMNYMFLISTAAGIVVCLLLIVFCFDIALRSVKLGFLRMIAPIPIVSRIDPKKGKDVFDKWVKVCISTYLDLFVRLLAIYFAIFVITQLVDLRFVDAVTGLESDVNAFVKVFIILGALMFAKQLPKLIEDITGLKMSGKFTLNPLKKLEDVPLAGKPLESGARFLGRSAKTLGGLGGAAIGTGLGMAGKFIDNKTGNRISGLRQNISSGIAGLRNSANSSIGGFLSRHSNIQSAVNRVGRDFASIRNDAQSTLYGAFGGIPGTSELLSGAAKRYDDQISRLETYAKFKDRLKTQANFDTTDLSQNSDIANIARGNVDLLNASLKGTKGLKQYYEDLQNSGTATVAEITQAREAWEKAQEITIDVGNESINYIKSEAARFVSNNRDIFGDAYSSSATASYTDINNGYIAAQGEITRIQTSEGYQSAQARKNAVPKKQ